MCKKNKIFISFYVYLQFTKPQIVSYRMRIIKTAFVLCVGILFQFNINAQTLTEKRKYVNDFLDIAPDARTIAMSKSALGTTLGSSINLFNPSLLALQDYHIGVSTMYSEMMGGVSKYNFFSFARKLNDQRSAIGLSLVRLGVDNIQNTLNLIGPDGSVDYNRVTFFSATELAFIFSYSKILSQDSSRIRTAIGGNAKLITKKGGSFAKAWGVGLDLSFTAKSRTVDFVASVRDPFGSMLNWTTSFTDEEKRVLTQSGNEIPGKSSERGSASLMLGLGKNFIFNDNFSLLLSTNIYNRFESQAGSISHSNNFTIDPNFGTEFNYKNRIMLRAGIGNFQKQTEFATGNEITTYSPSLGAGLGLGNFSIDYAISQFDSQDNPIYSHFISIDARLPKKNRSSEQNNTVE